MTQVATMGHGQIGDYARLLHTMLRVADLDRSIAFYSGLLGMTLFRREAYPEGRFTLAFLGYGSEASSTVLELTHNWDATTYEKGNAYGHVAVGVESALSACTELAAKGVRVVRPAGAMTHFSPDRAEPEVIAFVEDPDGYRVELIEILPKR